MTFKVIHRAIKNLCLHDVKINTNFHKNPGKTELHSFFCEMEINLHLNNCKMKD